MITMPNQYSFEDNWTSNWKYVIKRFVVVPLRQDGYNNMYIRPYTSKVGPQDIDSITQNFISGNFNKLNTANVLSVSSGILGEAGIIGGWNEKRYAFTLEVECYSKISPKVTEYIITGYSDPNDNIHDFYTVNLGGNMLYNQQFLFHINACKKMTKERTQISGIEDLGVIDNNSCPDFIKATLRPDDVVTSIQLSNMTDDMPGSSYYANNQVDINNITFDRKHNSSSSYVTSLFNAIKNNVGNTTANDNIISSVYRQQTNNILQGAVDYLAPTSISSEPFIRALNNSSLARQANKFTLAQLSSICPDFNSNHILVITPQEDALFNSASPLTASKDYTEGFNSADPIVPRLYDIHNNLIKFMMENFLGTIDITVWNDESELFSGRLEPKYQINNFATIKALSSEDQTIVSRKVNMGLSFLTKFIDQLLNPGIVRNDSFKYSLTVNMNLSLDSTLILSYAHIYNGQPRIFRFPTFADMSFTPMIGDQDTMDKLTVDMGQIVQSIQENF